MKKALCIGINDYPGTYNDLYGCVNDAMDWKNKLIDLDFDVVNVLLNSNATRGNILNGLKDLVYDALPGDLLVFTYSGHGTSVPDTSNPDEADGYDEALYVYDGTLLDDEFRNVLKSIQDDVMMFLILDSCFSGTMTRGDFITYSTRRTRRIKYMPSPHEGFASKVRALRRSKAFLSEEDMKEILLTGCSDSEYSYDAYINGRYNGAMSYTALHTFDESFSYEEWYDAIRNILPSQDYPQTPQLEGRQVNKEQQIFVEPIVSSEPSISWSSGSSISSSSAEEPPVIEPPSWIGIFLIKLIEWFKNLFGWLGK